MLKHTILSKLAALESLLLRLLVEKHVLGQCARVGQGEDVGVGAHAEGAHVACRVLGQSRSSNPNVLTFSQPAVLQVVHLGMPNLSTVVNDSHFRLIGVDLEKLNHFDLQVKIVEFAIFFSAYSRDVTETSNELVGKNGLAGEVSSGPLSQASDQLVLMSLHLDRFAEENCGLEFLSDRHFLSL